MLTVWPIWVRLLFANSKKRPACMVAFFRMAAAFRSKASLLEGMAFWKVRTFRLSKTRHAKTGSRRVLNLFHESISL